MTHFAMMPRIAHKSHRQEQIARKVSALNPDKPIYVMGPRTTKVFLNGALSETLPTGEIPCRNVSPA